MMKKRLLSLLLAVCTVASLLTLPAAAAATTNFSDVQDKETAVAVEALRLMGVLDGYGDGSFRPHTALNRGQFCKMAVYAMNGQDQLGLYRSVTVFPDVKPSHWAAPYINMAAKGKSIISGYPDGKFHPERTITLGQAVTILLRLLDYKDEHVGGVWPDSYMAIASTIGLTDGVGNNGNAALTRGNAARLFLNLLRTDVRGGGAYATTLADTTAIPNAMLVSSTADGPDGRGTALELADGAVYSLRDAKASSGMLNGYKGTLILTKKGGRVITFVPDSIGASKVITLSSAKATQLTDSTGTIYTMSSDIPVGSAGGNEDTWGTAYKWLTAGTSLTLYLNDAGEVEYVYQGSAMATSNKAVVVYSNGSTAGFDALTGGLNSYSIYKNGSPASAGDMRPYDVAIYDGVSNSIRVCDTRVTVYYEASYPNTAEPEKLTALGGTEFNVLATARESLSKFRPGDQVTLLLSEDGQVAGALDGNDGAARGGNALGIVQSGKVYLLCGSTKLLLKPSGDANYEGQVVRLSASKREGINMSRVSGGVSGELNIATRKLGGKLLAESVLVFENGVETSLSKLANQVISSSRVTYARTNWAGQVDLIVLDGGTSDTVYYGRAVVKDAGAPDPDADEYGGRLFVTVEYGAGKQLGPIRTGLAVSNGDYVAVTTDSGKTKLTSLRTLTEVSDVPNSAWISATAVSVGGRTYSVSADVPCYDRAGKTWVDLNTARGYADESTLYVADGVVRVVEVN